MLPIRPFARITNTASGMSLHRRLSYRNEGGYLLVFLARKDEDESGDFLLQSRQQPDLYIDFAQYILPL